MSKIMETPICPKCSSNTHVELVDTGENIGMVTGVASGIATGMTATVVAGCIQLVSIIGRRVPLPLPQRIALSAFGAVTGVIVGKKVGKGVDKWRGKYECKQCDNTFTV